MDNQIDIAAPAGTAPAQALVPIRRLVTAALICAVLSVGVLVSSAWHVMETTDAAEMLRERERASAIADIVGYDPAYATGEAIRALGKAGGLRGLSLADAPGAGEDSQSLPLLSGELGGKFLTWTTARPGRVLFQRFAPIRLPMGIGLILLVFACLVLMMRHVRRIERQRSEAEQQALSDHLTGLPNRLALEAKLQLCRQTKQGFSVLALDLDHFKPINDRFGHHAGDMVLKEVARRLHQQMQPGDMLARVGGDEFVAVVHRQGSSIELAELAQDCIVAISAPLTQIGAGVSVGISIGIVADGLSHPSGAPLKLADRALYDAKRHRGGTYRFAGEESVLQRVV